MVYILRSNTKGIVAEFLLSKDSDTTVILLDGLPSNISCKRDVIQKLISYGVSVIAPRYKGTRESEGQFLDHNPAGDIKEIIETVRNGEFIDLYNKVSYKLPSNKIVVIGVSFGGIVALDCLDMFKKNDTLILLSPLCDVIKFSHNLAEVRDFVKEGFGRAYNFDPKDWDNMVVGNLFKTDYSLIKENAKRIILIYDEMDSSILESDLLNFASQNKLENIIKLSGYGHLSYSKWDEKIYDVIGRICNLSFCPTN